MSKSVSILCLALASSGCGLLQITNPGQPSGAPAKSTSQLTYASLSICTEPMPGGRAGDRMHVDDRVRDDQTPAQQVRSVMCAYSPQDERRASEPSPLGDAITLSLCFASGHSRTNAPCDSPDMLAEAALLSRELQLPALKALVEGMDLDERFRSGFLSRVAAAAKRADVAVAGFDERKRRLYAAPIDSAATVWAEDTARSASIESRAKDLVKRLDAALLVGTDLPAVRTEVAALRDEAIRACTGAGRDLAHCAASRPARPLTETLVRLAIKANDDTAAAAELALVRLAPSRTSRGELIYAFARKAYDAERVRFLDYEEAQKQGVSEASLAERFGNPPPLRLQREAHVAAGTPPASIEGMVGAVEKAGQTGRATVVKRKLVRVAPSGGGVTLSFETRTATFTEKTGCHETNKPISISRSGRITYEEKCTGSKAVTERDTPAPVTVSAGEGGGLRPGRFVDVIADSRTRAGYLRGAYAKSENGRPVGAPFQIRAFATGD